MINYSQNDLLNIPQTGTLLPIIVTTHAAELPPPEPPPFLANPMAAYPQNYPTTYPISITPPPLPTATNRPPPEPPPDFYTTPTAAKDQLRRKKPDSSISPDRIPNPKRSYIQPSPGYSNPNSSSKLTLYTIPSDNDRQHDNKRKHTLLNTQTTKKHKRHNSPAHNTSPTQTNHHHFLPTPPDSDSFFR
jgi:hypothetical protein